MHKKQICQVVQVFVCLFVCLFSFWFCAEIPWKYRNTVIFTLACKTVRNCQIWQSYCLHLWTYYWDWWAYFMKIQFFRCRNTVLEFSKLACLKKWISGKIDFKTLWSWRVHRAAKVVFLPLTFNLSFLNAALVFDLTGVPYSDNHFNCLGHI